MSVEGADICAFFQGACVSGVYVCGVCVKSWSVCMCVRVSLVCRGGS